MRTKVVATGVVFVSLVAQIAAAQMNGAAPVPGVSFSPAPAPPPSRPTAPPPRALAGGSIHGGRVAPPPPPVVTPARPDLRRPTLGNTPAPPLDTRGPVDLYRANRKTYERILPPWLNSNWGGAYGAPYESTEIAGEPAIADREARPGYLVFRVEPAGTEVSVDGYYLGTVRDLVAGRAFPEGPYRLELRASGYDTMVTDLRILAGETITINRQLTRTPAAAPPAVAQAAPPAVAKPFYVIRGCYAGSTHPKDVRLPAGCDVNNVRVVPPVVNEVTSPRL